MKYVQKNKKYKEGWKEKEYIEHAVFKTKDQNTKQNNKKSRKS